MGLEGCNLAQLLVGDLGILIHHALPPNGGRHPLNREPQTAIKVSP